MGYNRAMAAASKESRFRKAIWAYYKAHGRHDLPWRTTDDPYAILISEVMLQQTQVARVEGFYEKWLKKFPDFASLARAGTADVLAAWQGLGYNRRALALKRLAETVCREHGGRLPQDRPALEALPGIGKGTSGSLMAFAFNRPEPFIETNIRRVFIHFFFPRARRGVTDAEISRYIERTLDRKRPREWYWALMDYGASMPKDARIGANPNRRSAHYRKQAPFRGSEREVRGKILRYLLSSKERINKEGRHANARPTGVPRAKLSEVAAAASPRVFEKALAGLVREGFISQKGARIYLNN